MSNQSLDMTVEVGYHHIPDLVISHHELCNQKLCVFAFCECSVFSFKFCRNLPSLLRRSIFQSCLYHSNRVVLEHEILDSPGYDLEQFCHQILTLIFWDMRLAAQALPQLFRSTYRIRIWFRRLPFLGERFLLCVRLS